VRYETIFKLLSDMTSAEIDNSIGMWAKRQMFAKQCAWSLSNVLHNAGYEISGVVEVGLRSLSGSPISQLDPSSVVIQCRAKDNISIIEKLSRFGESLSEMLDLVGLRVIAADISAVAKLGNEIRTNFGCEPLSKEMTLRGGTLLFPAFRDYRKRDWPGVSPVTSSGYQDAIHINRKLEARVIEVQVMTRSLFNKYVSRVAEESHEKFKLRQAAYYAEYRDRTIAQVAASHLFSNEEPMQFR
jgi:hypothetical protein